MTKVIGEGDGVVFRLNDTQFPPVVTSVDARSAFSVEIVAVVARKLTFLRIAAPETINEGK